MRKYLVGCLSSNLRLTNIIHDLLAYTVQEASKRFEIRLPAFEAPRALLFASLCHVIGCCVMHCAGGADSCSLAFPLPYPLISLTRSPSAFPSPLLIGKRNGFPQNCVTSCPSKQKELGTNERHEWRHATLLTGYSRCTRLSGHPIPPPTGRRFSSIKHGPAPNTVVFSAHSQ